MIKRKKDRAALVVCSRAWRSGWYPSSFFREELDEATETGAVLAAMRALAADRGFDPQQLTSED